MTVAEASLSFAICHTRCQGRNEVRWRPGQEATLAPHVRTWGLSEAKVLHWTLWRPATFGDFRKKNAYTHVALRENISAPVRVTDLVEASKDAASLLVRTRKTFFCLGAAFFCEWHHKWGTFRPPWPGPGRQPLGGSISLKFLLVTRLQSESFDTLDDLLGFRVQELWCKLVKIFD